MPPLFDALDFDSPQAEQPPEIILPLWPHQKAVLHIANRMENGEIFEMSPTTKIRSRLGYLNDPIGSGKTLTMLGIVAQKPAAEIFKPTGRVMDAKYSTKWIEEAPNCELKSTLIVVNNQIVFDQWINAIVRYTDLKHFAINKKKDYDFIEQDDIVNYINKFNIVIIKKTLFANFLNYYFTTGKDISHWERIIFDEAHEMYKLINTVTANFLWLVSGSYLTYSDSETFQIRSKDEFCNFSTKLPDIIVREYVCERKEREIYSVSQFIPTDVMTHINAGDIKGAIRKLSNNEDTNFHETDVIAALTKKFKLELKNVILDIKYTTERTMLEHVRREILDKYEAKKRELEEKIETIKTRVTSLREEKCSICFDDAPLNKVVINPCLHVACSDCMAQYIDFTQKKGHRLTCQMCRTNINIGNMRLIGAAGASTSAAAHVPPAPTRLYKVDQALAIVRANRTGRYLIFAHYDATFTELAVSVPSSEILQGDAVTVRKIVDGFKAGRIKSLIINSKFYAAGMNLQEATDVILMQNLGANEAQCIGRAQRPGRTERLRVHRLVYQDE